MCTGRRPGPGDEGPAQSNRVGGPSSEGGRTWRKRAANGTPRAALTQGASIPMPAACARAAKVLGRTGSLGMQTQCP